MLIRNILCIVTKGRLKRNCNPARRYPLSAMIAIIDGIEPSYTVKSKQPPYKLHYTAEHNV